MVAFRWLDGRWEQVPVQVDERARVDLGRMYNSAAIGLTQLTCANAGTFAGPYPDPRVDADDEIALMGIDSGVRAPAGSRPAGVVAGTGHELRITDPLGDPTAAYVYLFRQAGGLDPAAGRRYVDYRFGLRSGDYKSTYRLQQGPNPEDSTVITAAYTRHFSDRWVDDGLAVRSGGATGTDILDRNTAGVRVDGVPDAPALGSLAWESVDGPPGGLTSVHRYETDIAGFATTSYYLDQRTPTGTAERQCTGDAAAHGASGPRIAQAIPNTDPRSQPANRLTVTRALFVTAPGSSDGPRRAAQVATPLTVSVADVG